MSVDFLSKNFPPFQVHHAKKPPRFYPDGFQRNVIDFYFIFSDCRLRKALYLQFSYFIWPLSKTDMYGYQIIKTLEVMSENVFSLNEGTLYPILHSLEKEGSLESYWCEAEGRKRKYYKITESGLAELADKKREWQSFSGAVSKVLGGAKLAAEV